MLRLDADVPRNACARGTSFTRTRAYESKWKGPWTPRPRGHQVFFGQVRHRGADRRPALLRRVPPASLATVSNLSRSSVTQLSKAMIHSSRASPPLLRVALDLVQDTQARSAGTQQRRRRLLGARARPHRRRRPRGLVGLVHERHQEREAVAAAQRLHPAILTCADGVNASLP